MLKILVHKKNLENFEFSWYAHKKGSESSVCLEQDGNISFDPGTNAGIFKDLYSNLAGNLVKELPTATFKYGMDYVKYYYTNINFPVGPFGFSHVHKILDILQKFETNKATDIGGLSGIFLKDGARILVKPITDLINLSISLSTVPDSCKVAKLKPLFKKGSKSLLPLISKVLEKVVHDQIQTFLTDKYPLMLPV